jgi:hypothetical protein
MERTQIIDYQGKKIFFMDFSNLKTTKEIQAVIQDSQKYIRSQPFNSVISLTSVGGMHFNNEIREMFAAFLKGNKPYMKASAVIGINGLMRIIYDAVMKITGRELNTFATIDKAKAWLVTQK